MLVISGFILLCLGLLTGVALVLGPLGFWTADPGLSAYILFALLSVIGYLLVAVASRTMALPLLSRITGALLLLLAVSAAAGLVLTSVAIIKEHGPTIALWYVFAVGGLVGTGLLTVHRAAGAR
jgi:hypothetical protein